MGVETGFLPYNIFTVIEVVQVRAVLARQPHLSVQAVGAAAKGNDVPVTLSHPWFWEYDCPQIGLCGTQGLFLA